MRRFIKLISDLTKKVPNKILFRLVALSGVITWTLFIIALFLPRNSNQFPQAKHINTTDAFGLEDELVIYDKKELNAINFKTQNIRNLKFTKASSTLLEILYWKQKKLLFWP